MTNKILIFLVVGLITIFSCNNAETNKQTDTDSITAATSPNLKLQIYYFHATNRCPTCIGIETNVKQALDAMFKDELLSGQINLKVLCVDDKANKDLVEKYEAAGAALHLVKYENGKESDHDLTEFAFMHSQKEPDFFIKSFQDSVSKFIR